MRKAVKMAAAAIALLACMPTLSRIGRQQPGTGAEAWTAVEGPALAAPEWYSDRLGEMAAAAAVSFDRARELLPSGAYGPRDVASLLAGVDCATAAFQGVGDYYQRVLAHLRNEEMGLLDKVAVLEEEFGRVEREQKLMRRGIDNLRPSQQKLIGVNREELPPSTEDRTDRMRYLDIRAGNLESERQDLKEQIGVLRGKIDALVVEKEYVERMSGKIDEFYDDICYRIKVMSWSEPDQGMRPELRAGATLPSQAAGNALVFAMHAKEPWLRRYAIEQLGYWRGFYPEAGAVLEYIRQNDPDEDFAALAQECLLRR